MKRLILLGLVSIFFLTLKAQENKVIVLNAKDFHIKTEEIKNSLILDCSSLEAYLEEHIEGAITIATSEMMKSLLADVDKETPLFVYCKLNIRSKTAVVKIQELGFKHIYELEKGLEEWKRQGFKTTNKQ